MLVQPLTTLPTASTVISLWVLELKLLGLVVGNMSACPAVKVTL
jgi:hypothetical protein